MQISVATPEKTLKSKMRTNQKSTPVYTLYVYTCNIWHLVHIKSRPHYLERSALTVPNPALVSSLELILETFRNILLKINNYYPH